MVLVHSLGPGHDGSEWERSAVLLAVRYHVVAPDLPGWGRSAGCTRPPSPELYVDFLHDFLAEVVRAPATVVAVGRSAAYLVHLAVAHPELVRAVGLVAPWGMRRERRRPDLAERLTRVLVEAPMLGTSAVAFATRQSAVERHLRQEVYAAPERVDAALVEHHVTAAHQPGAQRALAAYLAGELDLDVAAEAADLERPVWIAWGRRCIDPPVERADLWLRRFPDAHLDVFEQSGLLPHAEEPAAFCHHLEEFLNRNAA